MSKETKVVVIRESVVSSIIKDSVTFALFVGMLYFNHKVLDGNGWIDAIFIVLALMFVTSLNMTKIFKGNAKEAIKWIQENAL